jgi:hypothetical protein
METIPLADGDLRWVFPELADHLGVRPAWTRSGPTVSPTVACTGC